MRSPVPTPPRRGAPALPALLPALLLALLLGSAGAAAPTPQRGASPTPLMAYYYIWFDVPSWERAKTDYPLLGRYSSDDPEVMRQHVRWAKEAGIDGFIVSWKSTYKLDRRLEQLMDIAAEEGFFLWIIYQGLDFERQPLPVGRVDADLDLFVRLYADHPAFAMYDKPVVIWSGTWEYGPQEVFSASASHRDHLYLLASERTVEGYRQMAHAVDGNAYYWSSVNPDTFPGYELKLSAMAREVHASGGMWVAPAAPGFDAREVGGTTVVERHDGNTLRRQLDAATRSSPDAIGLISWNEFSENTHIEPSREYGTRMLEVLADRSSAVAPVIVGFDSDAPAVTDHDDRTGIMILAGFALAMAASLGLLVRRTDRWRNFRARRRQRRMQAEPPG